MTLRYDHQGVIHVPEEMVVESLAKPRFQEAFAHLRIAALAPRFTG